MRLTDELYTWIETLTGDHATDALVWLARHRPDALNDARFALREVAGSPQREPGTARIRTWRA